MKTVRKPRVLTAGRVYPRIEARDGRIMMQNSYAGNWIKVPLKRAEYIQKRLTQAIKYISQK